MRGVRALLIFKLGFWLGLAAAAAFAKRALPRGANEDSEELSLVAIFDGIELESRATTFRGGSMVAWFGGIDVDLSSTELAPGARLSANTLFGGISVKTPPGWRVESNAKALVGGIAAQTPAADDPDAPVLTLDGLAVIGGIAVGGDAGRPPAES